MSLKQQQDPKSPTDSRQRLFDAVSQHLDVGSFADFNSAMDDPVRRKRFFDGVSQSVDLGSQEEFESKIAPKISGPGISEILEAPGAKALEGLGQMTTNPLAGAANIGNALIGTVALPFAAGEYGLRQAGDIGNRIADAVTLPFRGIAQGVQSGQQVIDSGLKAIGIEGPENPEAARAISELNQGMAQFLVPGVAKSLAQRGRGVPVERMETAPKPIEEVVQAEKPVELPAQTEMSFQMGVFPGLDKVLDSIKDLGPEIVGKVKGLFTDKDLGYTPPASQAPSVMAMREVIKEMKPFPGRAERLYQVERSKRSGRLAGIFEDAKGEETFHRAMSAAKGELPKPQFDPIRPKLQEWIGDLFDQISRSEEIRPYEKLSAQGALAELLDGKRPPRRYELKLFEKVFGSDLVKDLMGKRPWREKAWDNIMEAVNLPRALMASMDMSAALRQGGILGASHPTIAGPAFVDMHKYFFSEKALKALDENIEARPNARIYSESGLYIGERRGEALELTKREEAFMSHMADRIPVLGKLVKASERAYLGYLNKLRVDVFDMVDKELKKSGYSYEKNPEVFAGLSDFINKATGRGNLGKYGERVAPLLNAFFFAPRNMAAKLQLLNPATYARLPKPIRVLAMKDMLKFVGAGTALLTLAKMGGAQVELDPRSSDFAKIRVGDTRLDPWGGFQQFVRFAAQLTTGERKSSTTGKITPMDKQHFPFTSRLDLVYRFGEQKLSPQAGFVADMLRGESMIGEKFDLTREASERLTPLYMQDLLEASKGSSPETMLMGIPAFYGAGVQTYSAQPKKSKKTAPTRF